MHAHWPGFSDEGGLVLPLRDEAHFAPDMPVRLRLDGHVLERKHELHLTLLDRKRGAALRDCIGEDGVRALFESMEWEPHGIRRYALLHRTKDEWNGPLQAWSVIEHLQEPALSAFRHGLAQASGLDLDAGVPHVTLYVAGDPSGIGVPGVAAYRDCFVREVVASELCRAGAM